MWCVAMCTLSLNSCHIIACRISVPVPLCICMRSLKTASVTLTEHTMAVVNIVAATNNVAENDEIALHLSAAAAHVEFLDQRVCLCGQDPETLEIIQPGNCCRMCEYNSYNTCIVKNDFNDANEHRGFSCCMQPGVDMCIGLDPQLLQIIESVLEEHAAAVRQERNP